MFTKKIALLLTSLIMIMCAMPLDAHAQRERVSNRGSGANLCSTQKPKVTVKLATSKTKYNKNHSARTINQIHNSNGGGTILGLAGGPIEITMRGQYEIRTRNQKACVQLSKVEVLFWAKPLVVIASNFKKGSCEYREVLAHEQKHIRATRKFVREHAPKLRKEVRRIMETSKTHTVVSAQKTDKAQESIQGPIIKRLFGYQNKVMPVLRSRQAEIDTPAEYARVAAQCKNWGKKLARN